MNEFVLERMKPGVFLLNTSKSVDRIKQLISDFGYQLFYLNGKEISIKEELFRHTKKSLGLSPELGENWDAYYDCLTGFNWQAQGVSGDIIFYEHFHYFAAEKPDDFYVAYRSWQRAAIDVERKQKIYLLLSGKTESLPDQIPKLSIVEL